MIAVSHNYRPLDQFALTHPLIISHHQTIYYHTLPPHIHTYASMQLKNNPKGSVYDRVTEKMENIENMNCTRGCGRNRSMERKQDSSTPPCASALPHKGNRALFSVRPNPPFQPIFFLTFSPSLSSPPPSPLSYVAFYNSNLHLL